MEIPLTAIVLVGGKINSKLFKKCLDSLKFADEIIKVETSKIKGSFSEWRNYGLKKAKNSWVLYIDIDEEVTDELQNEITEIISKSENYSCYAIPRKNIIFGQVFKHGGTWPDFQKRLFRKEKISRWKGDLHEEPEFVGEIGLLKNPIIHHKDITISEMIDKTNEWSEIEAKLLFNSNHPKMNLVRFFSAGFREFYLRFIRELCFLDGTKGVIYGIYQIYSRLITYSKLWEKQLSITRT